MTATAVSEAVRVTDGRDAALALAWQSVIVDPTIKARLINHAVLALHLRPVIPFQVSAVHGPSL